MNCVTLHLVGYILEYLVLSFKLHPYDGIPETKVNVIKHTFCFLHFSHILVCFVLKCVSF